MAENSHGFRVNQYETLYVQTDDAPGADPRLAKLGKDAMSDFGVDEAFATHQQRSGDRPAGAWHTSWKENTLSSRLHRITNGNTAKVVVGTLAASVLIGTGVAHQVFGSNEASAAAGSVEHRVVHNSDKMRALGLCANELIAQAEFNQRANVKSPIGFSSQDYYGAAHFAQANEIPCFPDRAAVVVSDDQEMKAATAEQISAFDAVTACDQLADATHGDANGSNGANAITASIDKGLIADLNIACQ